MYYTVKLALCDKKPVEILKDGRLVNEDIYYN